jgi:hypothetical protein
MQLIKSIINSLKIELVDINPQMPAFGKLDNYNPEQLKAELEMDTKERRKQIEK